jgi:hypothetical protein
MNIMVPTSHVRFEDELSASPNTPEIEAVAKIPPRTIKYNHRLLSSSMNTTSTTQVTPGTKAAVIKPVPMDLLHGILRCKASIIEGIQNDVFQDFIHKFGLTEKSAEIESYVHQGRPGYKKFLAFCNARFKADPLLGVGAFDDMEMLSTDYKAFMTTFHQIWTCRIEPVKAANLTDLMEATAHEGPITLNDTQMAALKELHDMYWGEHGPVDLP